jgi:hypothetical protein
VCNPILTRFISQTDNLKFKKLHKPHAHSSTFTGAQKPAAQSQPAKELQCQRTGNTLLPVIKANTFVPKTYKHKSSYHNYPAEYQEKKEWH